MPEFDNNTTLKITPEVFLRKCSRSELIEIDRLLQTPINQTRMYGSYAPEADNKKQLNIQPIKIETT